MGVAAALLVPAAGSPRADGALAGSHNVRELVIPKRAKRRVTDDLSLVASGRIEIDGTLVGTAGAKPTITFKVVGSGSLMPIPSPFEQTLAVTATSVSVCRPQD